jgi:hypothetical protein
MTLNPKKSPRSFLINFITGAQRAVISKQKHETVFLLRAAAGLPDGKFAYQKFQFGYIWEGHGKVNVGKFYGCLEYFMTIF